MLETNGRALVEAIGLIPGRKHLVFEEAAQSAWLYEILSPHVDEAMVAGVSKSRGQKDDQRDAYGLAEKLRTGTLDKRILKAPGRGQFTMLRELARTHQTTGRDLVRVQRVSRASTALGGSKHPARRSTPRRIGSHGSSSSRPALGPRVSFLTIMTQAQGGFLRNMTQGS